MGQVLKQLLHFRNVCSYPKPPGNPSGIMAGDVRWNMFNTMLYWVFETAQRGASLWHGHLARGPWPGRPCYLNMSGRDAPGRGDLTIVILEAAASTAFFRICVNPCHLWAGFEVQQ